MDQTKMVLGGMLAVVALLAAADVSFITGSMKRKYTDESVKKYNRAALAGELLFVLGFILQGQFGPDWLGWLIMGAGAAVMIAMMRFLVKK